MQLFYFILLSVIISNLAACKQLSLIPVVLQDFKAIDIEKTDNCGALCAAMEFILNYRRKQIRTKFTL